MCNGSLMNVNDYENQHLTCQMQQEEKVQINVQVSWLFAYVV